MERILTHINAYGFDGYKVYKLIDMYSPYIEENRQIDFHNITFTDYETINNLGYLNH